MPAMRTKIMCHSENSITSWPRLGATTGMIMNTMKTSDMTSAMARPPNTSRMIDTVMTRVAAAPSALDEAQDEKRLEARRESCSKRGCDIDRKAAKQRDSPAEAVGQRAEPKLREAEACDIGGDHILPVVFVLDAKAGADLLQSGQHDVDGQRIERHEGCGKRDELPARDRQAACLAGRGGLLVHENGSTCGGKGNAPEAGAFKIDEARKIPSGSDSDRQAAPLTLTPFSTR